MPYLFCWHPVLLLISETLLLRMNSYETYCFGHVLRKNYLSRDLTALGNKTRNVLSILFAPQNIVAATKWGSRHCCCKVESLATLTGGSGRGPLGLWYRGGGGQVLDRGAVPTLGVASPSLHLHLLVILSLGLGEERRQKHRDDDNLKQGLRIMLKPPVFHHKIV